MSMTTQWDLDFSIEEEGKAWCREWFDVSSEYPLSLFHLPSNTLSSHFQHPPSPSHLSRRFRSPQVPTHRTSSLLTTRISQELINMVRRASTPTYWKSRMEWTMRLFNEGSFDDCIADCRTMLLYEDPPSLYRIYCHTFLAAYLSDWYEAEVR
jgi:hypothetical protein